MQKLGSEIPFLRPVTYERFFCAQKLQFLISLNDVTYGTVGTLKFLDSIFSNDGDRIFVGEKLS